MLNRRFRFSTAHLFLSGLIVLVFTGRLRAEEDDPDAEFQLDVGPNVTLGPWSDVCEKDYDVISCVVPTILPEVTLGARYRKEQLALGGIAVLGRLHNTEIMTATMWRAALEGRYFTHVGRVLDHWFALELGVVGAHSKSDWWTPYGDSGTDTEHELGPELGAGMGLDFQMGKYFAIGFSWRVLWLVFFEVERTDQWDHALNLYKTLWFTMGAHLRFSFPR